MLKASPDPIDVQDLQFKLQCRLKIFDNKSPEAFSKPCNLISSASRYGLLFVGTNTINLQVVQLKCVENYKSKDKEVKNFPRRNISLPSPPTHISVNCDSTIVAILVVKDQCPTVLLYNVLSFFSANITLVKEFRLSPSPNVQVLEVGWNPTIPTILTACKNDGTLGVYEIKDNSIDINELPVAANATCFSWSPRGKQVAVGSRDGKITQYKPDLKAVKVINPPNFPTPVSLISLQWVSNFQFIGVYNGEQSCVVVVDAPKTGETTYTNYDDICYSGSTRLPQFYMILQPIWNILMVASANGTEVGVMGLEENIWKQWIMEDSARAELPLGKDHEDTFPVGVALDTSAVNPLSWGEATIPPAPYLLLLSHQGLLSIFNVINLKSKDSICSAPDRISDLSGMQLFTTENNSARTNVAMTATTAALPLTFKPPTFTQPTLNSNQVTITPIQKQGAKMLTDKISSQPSEPQNSEKYPAIFSSLKTNANNQSPIFTVMTTPFQQTDVISTTISKPFLSAAPLFTNSSNLIPAAAVPQTASSTKTLSLTIPTSASAEQTKSQTSTNIKSITDKSDIESNKNALYHQLVKDEIAQLESEMKMVLSQNRDVKINVGTEEEKIHLVTNIDDLEGFIKDIEEICTGQSAEIHYLKQNLIQSWAWFEEARSRYNSTKDESMAILLKALPLDSASEKHLKNITHSLYYLETQLSQANKALDEQWENFQDYAKKSYRKSMPTMETIFQTMVRQNIILQKQEYVLKDINYRIKGQKRSGLLLDSVQDGLTNLSLTETENICQIQYERFLNRTKPISKDKTVKLREILINHKPLRVSAAKSQFSSAKKTMEIKEMISRILEAQQTPVAKELGKSVVKNLNFENIDKIQTPPNTLAEVLSEKIPPISSLTFNFNKSVTTSNSALKVPVSSKWGITDVASTIVSATPIKPADNFAFKSSSVSNLITSTPKPPIFNFSSSAAATISPVSSGSSTFKFSSAPKIAVTTTTQLIIGSITSSASAPVISKPTTTSAKDKDIKATVDTTVPSTFGNNLFTSSIFGKPTDSNAFVTSSGVTNVDAKSTSKSKNTDSVKTSTTTTTTIQNNFKMPEVQQPIFGSTQLFSKATLSSTSSTSPIFKSTTASTPSIFSIAAANAIKSSSSSIFDTLTLDSTTTDNATSNSSTAINSSVIAKMTESTRTATVTTATATTKSILDTTLVDTSKLPFGTSSESTNLSVTTASTTAIFGAKSSIFGSANSISTSSTSSFTSSKTTTTTRTTSATVIISTVAAPTVSISSSEAAPCSISADKPFSLSSTSTIAASRSNATSIFDSATISATTTTTTLVFGSASSPTTPLFGTSTALTTTSGSTSIFESTTTKSSIFGTTSSTPVFGGSVVSSTAATTTTSIFDSSLVSTTTSTNTPSILGGLLTSSATLTTTGSIFGSPIVSNATQIPTASIFEGSVSSSETLPTTLSILGSPTVSTTTTITTPIFGNAVTSASLHPTSQTSSFGSFVSTPSIFTSSTKSIFGSASVTTNASTSSTPLVFGNVVTSTPSTSSSPFGGANTNIFANVAANTPATTQSIFGGQSTNLFAPKTTASSTIFGGSNNSTSPFSAQPVFGPPSSTISSPFAAATNTQPIFGSSGFGAAPTTTASVFGQPASVFGSPSVTVTSVTTNLFGSSATTTNATFGGGAIFGAAASSTSPFGTSSTTSNVFGSASAQPSSFSFASAGSNQTGSSFGFGSLNVGATTTCGNVFGGSGFGQSSTTTANPFGKANNKSIFGNGPATSTPTIFGSPSSSGFGASPSFGSSSFGQPVTFGASAFGSSSFGSNSQTTGPFSSGGAGVAQTGFGSPTASFQKPVFGAAPVFGGSPQPSFGGSPNFGGAPTFGSSPTFGSPNKIFGSGTSTDTFAQQTTQSAGFGNLANQNTVGFGNLAQQANQSNSSAFSGSSSFSSWR